MNRRHRLSGRRTFARVRARRISAQSGPVRIHVAPSPGTLARVGFSIPRSVGGAARRNRLRRQLRALVALRLAALAPIDVIVGVTPPAAALSTAELAPHVAGALDATLDALATQGVAMALPLRVSAPRLQPA